MGDTSGRRRFSRTAQEHASTPPDLFDNPRTGKPPRVPGRHKRRDAERGPDIEESDARTLGRVTTERWATAEQDAERKARSLLGQ